MTTSKEKNRAEKKHRMITNFLKKKFPDCTITYNGDKGHDHRIINNGKEIVIETRTCKKIMLGGMVFKKTGELFYHRVRLGTIKFENREWMPPYKISQHRDLLEKEGWYIFVIGKNLITGIQAKEIDKHLSKKRTDWKIRRISWSTILGLCHPDWIEQLEEQVRR